MPRVAKSKAATLALVLAFAASAAMAESAEPSVQALALLEAFCENSVAAEQKFQGKPLVVAGTIEKISKSVGGKPYVVLAGQSPLSFVQCVFDPADAPALSQFKPGAPITIGGTLDGQVVGLMMSGCNLVP